MNNPGMSEYVTTEKIAIRWGISERRVRTLCSEGRILGAIKPGGEWLIPNGAIRPIDQRRKSLTHELEAVGRPDNLSLSGARNSSFSFVEDEHVKGVCVKDLFNIKYFSTWRVVGGQNGLNTAITSMNLMESPDIALWATKNQFIVTTGYCIRDDVNVQKQVMRDLSAKGCSGLAIKILRFFRTIPQHMIDLADELDLPLIEIPEDYNISVVMNNLMQEVFVREHRTMGISFSIYKDLAKASFGDDVFGNISTVLGQYCNASVTISDSNWVVQGAHENVKTPIKLYDLLKHESPITIPYKSKTPLTYPLLSANDNLFRIIYAVSSENQIFGYLTFWQESPDITGTMAIASEHATEMIAQAFRRSSGKDDVRYKRERVFDDLIHGKIHSKEVLTRRSLPLGFNCEDEFICAVSPNKKETRSGEDWPERHLVDCIEKTAKGMNIYIDCLEMDDHFAMIIAAPRILNSEPHSGEKDVSGKELINSIYRNTREYLNKPFLLASGNISPAISLYRSYKQAKEALSLASHCNQNNDLVFFNDIELDILLMKIPQSERQQLMDEVTKRLEYHDIRHNMDLVQTLQTYFDHNQNASQASRELYIHRNTFLYRMERAKQVLGLDFDNCEDALKVQIALKISKYQNSLGG